MKIFPTMTQEDRCEYSRLKRLAFPERYAAITKRWRDKNPGYGTKRRRANRDHYNSMARARYQRDPSKQLRASKRWMSKYPHKKQEHVRKRRARLRQCEWQNCDCKITEILSAKRCYWCGIEFDLIRRPEVDHVIPTIRGGNHVPDNLVASCSPCNRSKGGKLFWEWDEELAG
jgi:5-methylcytosine-specific restriction endonuclease McrA